MNKTRIFAFLLIFLGTVLPATSCYAEPPRVAVSIRPLYFLATELMHGVGKPELILTGQQSPHHYHIRPSQLRGINQANIVLWIGPSLESTLQKTIQNLPNNIEHYALLDTAGLHILKLSGTGHKHDHDHADTPQNLNDPHIWLETDNAAQLSRFITEVLIKHDPSKKTAYQHNLSRLEKKLSALQKNISSELEALTTTRILALHDAWRYFAHDFRLQGYQSIHADGLEHLGARSFLSLKKEIDKKEFVCVIGGPETNYKKAQQLTAESKTPLIILDPLGNDLPADTDYEEFMQHISKNLQNCITQN